MAIFLWVLFCILAGVFANNRGRSFIFWFIISMLLSPLISVIVLLLLKNIKLDDKNFHRVLNDSSRWIEEHDRHKELISIISNNTNHVDTKICPYCAETIKMKANLCRYCGSTLVSDSP